MPRKKIPSFANEGEEARWWDKHRAELDKDFLEAAAKGRLFRLGGKKLGARIRAATRVISMRLAEADLALARSQARKMGLPYQTYIKSLLHRALRRAE